MPGYTVELQLNEDQ